MTAPPHPIYLDNAATTFPKPREVIEAMCAAYLEAGVSPGRGSHDLAVEAERRVEAVRSDVCAFFGGPDPDRTIFSGNSTDALNTLIQGVAAPGVHMVSSRLEHNSVLRPLHHLREAGLISVTLVPANSRGFLDPEAVARAIRPETRLVILNHASNVIGTVQPAAVIGALCRERGVPLALDCSQSAGVIPVDMASMNVSAVAFTGHKSLLGPTGIGGLVLSRGIEVRATRFGGTGVESRKLTHTDSYPHRLEAGTLNVLGIYGLGAALRFLEKQGGAGAIHAREMALCRHLRDGLAAIPRVVLYRAESLENHVAILLFNLAGMAPSDLAAILDADFGVATRPGLHCAPLVHEDLGTCPAGAVRLSLGPFTTEEDIEAAISAVAVIAAGG